MVKERCDADGTGFVCGNATDIPGEHHSPLGSAKLGMRPVASEERERLSHRFQVRRPNGEELLLRVGELGVTDQATVVTAQSASDKCGMRASHPHLNMCGEGM